MLDEGIVDMPTIPRQEEVHANRPDDPEYIVRLLGQVITVSLETVNVVKALPSLGN